jgi:hypothetical protein
MGATSSVDLRAEDIDDLSQLCSCMVLFLPT